MSKQIRKFQGEFEGEFMKELIELDNRILEVVEIEKKINEDKSKHDEISCSICCNYKEVDQMTQNECEDCKRKDFCDNCSGMYYSTFLCRECFINLATSNCSKVSTLLNSHLTFK